MLEDIKQVDRSKYATMSNEKRIRIVRDMHIAHPRYQFMFNIVRKCHQSPHSANELQCALIEGNPGVGKSRLINEYIRQYGIVSYSSNSKRQTILHCEVTSPARISSFTEDMLDRLGDYNPTAGKTATKITRLARYIKDNQVELIIVDEFQHFMSPSNSKVNYDVADHFKSIINLTNVPVVIFGLETDARTVIHSNKQLKDRFSITENLHPFGIENEERVNEFRTLLFTIDQNLPFVQSSNLADPEFYRRLYSATSGTLRPMMKLIREAAEIAIYKGHTHITTEDFVKAGNVHRGIIGDTNPFTM
jgi:hypothetical protein